MTIVVDCPGVTRGVSATATVKLCSPSTTSSDNIVRDTSTVWPSETPAGSVTVRTCWKSSPATVNIWR